VARRSDDRGQGLMIMRVRLLGAVCILALILTISRAQSGGQEYIVTLNNGHSIGALNNSHGTKTIGHIANTSTYLVQTDGDDGSATVLNNIQNDPGVDVAEKNHHIRLRSRNQAALDPSLVQEAASLLDGHTMTTFYGTNVLMAYVNQPALTITQVSNVRSLSTGAATHVAYIDTGVDFNHPALSPWLDPGVDLVFNRSASELDGLSQEAASLLDQEGSSLLDQEAASLLDRRFIFLLNQEAASLLDSGDGGGVFPSEFGHGTLVAGVIHAVAPGARIVPIKAFDAYGNTTMFTIIEAVQKAKDLNVDVLNMSFSTSQNSETLRRAIVSAQAAGIAVVASAGNDASALTDFYPASYPTVIGVGATDFADRLAGFSNYGQSVSVTAPGAYVVSTFPGGRYAAAWGTSFSAPMVSGALALMASARGHGHSDTALVQTTADNIDSLNPGLQGMLGKGRLNALQALTVKN
jgi:subtilisin family serine protease